jgi:hypothetical protein
MRSTLLQAVHTVHHRALTPPLSPNTAMYARCAAAQALGRALACLDLAIASPLADLTLLAPLQANLFVGRVGASTVIATWAGALSPDQASQLSFCPSLWCTCDQYELTNILLLVDRSCRICGYPSGPDKST